MLAYNLISFNHDLMKNFIIQYCKKFNEKNKNHIFTINLVAIEFLRISHLLFKRM